MTREIAISVIVPIYNVEKYLHKCLTSLKEQSFENFDVFMIDDGSDDKSGDIARGFAKKDSRFNYTHIERSGVANARNVGVAKADGEFIAFVDSDDFVEKDYLQTLYRAAVENNCKISSCNYCIFYEEKPLKEHKVRVRKLRTGVYSRDKYLTQVIRDWSVRSYLWNKLWHRSLFDDNNIAFPNMYFEDIATVARLVFHTNSVAVVDKPLYHYTVRSNSIMTTIKVEKINDYILSYGIVRNYIEYNGELKKFRLVLIYFSFIIYFANYYNVYKLHRSRRNFKNIVQNQRIANKCIVYFAGRKFKATAEHPTLPQYIVSPEERCIKPKREKMTN